MIKEAEGKKVAKDNCRRFLRLNEGPLWGYGKPIAPKCYWYQNQVHSQMRGEIEQNDQKGNLPNNANNLFLSFSLACTYKIAMAL